MTDLIHVIEQLFPDLRGRVSETTTFDEIEFDSLVFSEIAVVLSARLGVQIDEGPFLTAATVGAAAQAIDQELRRGAPVV